MKNKKTLSVIVATVLILTVSIISIITFTNWFGNFSSNLITDVEEENFKIKQIVKIDSIHGRSLYVKKKNLENLTIEKITINGINCFVNNNNIQKNLEELRIEKCDEEIDIGTVEIVIQTKNNIIKENFFLNKKIKDEREIFKINYENYLIFGQYDQEVHQNWILIGNQFQLEEDPVDLDIISCPEHFKRCLVFKPNHYTENMITVPKNSTIAMGECGYGWKDMGIVKRTFEDPNQTKVVYFENGKKKYLKSCHSNDNLIGVGTKVVMKYCEDGWREVSEIAFENNILNNNIETPINCKYFEPCKLCEKIS